MEAYGGPLDGQDIKTPGWRTDFEVVGGTAYVTDDGTVLLDSLVYRVEQAPWGKVLVAEGWHLSRVSSRVSRDFMDEATQQAWVDETTADLRARSAGHPEVGLAFESRPGDGCRLTLVYLVKS